MDNPRREGKYRGRFSSKKAKNTAGGFRTGGRKSEGNSKGGGEKGWDGVAGWYDKMVGVDGSDYHQKVILPAVMDLLDLSGGEEVIDICCGQGVLVKHLLSERVEKVLGVDASAKLIESARGRYGRESGVDFLRADACVEGDWADGSFDAAACVMAVHDVPDIDGLMKNISAALKPGGKVAIVMMHPCFRIPKESHWGWDGDQKIQFRRLDKYGRALEIGIQTRPGLGTDESTVFYHRPLADVISSMGDAGLGVMKCVELFSHRRSQVGPFSKAEHRAAEEFPLFLGLKAVKA
ncbi:class I SAM-dependent methyltransferase [Luteolibacter sp. AS25]|uniref:class I SAM-dependent methyltransferase n=1 Tax=Luteolibacter sp. AS25 TaxID=3135776 RepID=UPI00398A78F5